MTNAKRIYSVINNDHDYLFNSLHNLRKMITGIADKDAISNVLRLITFEFQSHFIREEEMMEAHKFPQLEEHRQSHLVVTQVLLTIISSMTHSDREMTTDDVDYINDLLIRHISVDDAPFEKFMDRIKTPNTDSRAFSTASLSQRALQLIGLLSSRAGRSFKAFGSPQESVEAAPLPTAAKTARQGQTEGTGGYCG